MHPAVHACCAQQAVGIDSPDSQGQTSAAPALQRSCSTAARRRAPVSPSSNSVPSSRLPCGGGRSSQATAATSTSTGIARLQGGGG